MSRSFLLPGAVLLGEHEAEDDDGDDEQHGEDHGGHVGRAADLAPVAGAPGLAAETSNHNVTKVVILRAKLAV